MLKKISENIYTFLMAQLIFYVKTLLLFIYHNFKRKRSKRCTI